MVMAGVWSIFNAVLWRLLYIFFCIKFRSWHGSCHFLQYIFFLWLVTSGATSSVCAFSGWRHHRCGVVLFFTLDIVSVFIKLLVLRRECVGGWQFRVWFCSRSGSLPLLRYSWGGIIRAWSPWLVSKAYPFVVSFMTTASSLIVRRLIVVNVVWYGWG